ncbi:MAG: hypothetical protein HY928_04785 [Elusimicrobia bacterium]|nr:hypothetical protein [Elusimicrobiota bacterium]
MDSFHDFVLLLFLVAAARAQQGSEAACAAPRYEKEAAAAVAQADRLEPSAASSALERLSSAGGTEGLQGHPVMGALLAVRGKGIPLRRAVYCAARGGHWIGVESADGRYFRLPIGDDSTVDMSRLEEARRPAPRRAELIQAGAASLAVYMASPAALASGDPVSLVGTAALRDALAEAPGPSLPAAAFEDYCAQAGCRSRKARASIDTDGWVADPALRALVRSRGFDRHHRDDTHLSYAGASPKDPARYLDATRVPYVVRHRDSPWRLGDIVVVEHGGRRVAAVVGDSGNRRRINEISYAAAQRLDIDAHGNLGGTESPVKVTHLAGLVLERPADEAQLLSALERVQSWLDGGAQRSQGLVHGGLKGGTGARK